MAHYLDSLPFDWEDPAARELRNFLASSYFREAPVIKFVQEAGIPPATIAWGQPMLDVWHDVIEKARSQGRLRDLLERIAEGPDAAVALRLAELTAAAPVVAAPADVLPASAWKNFDGDGFERQLVADDYTLLDIAFLRRGLELAPAVARLRVTFAGGKYYGTGFRISDDRLLTNHHVLYDHAGGDAPATEVEAWFGYESDFAGRPLAHEKVACDPATIRGEKTHDWAVIGVSAPMPAATPVIKLDEYRPVRPDDRVYIIQHPNGGMKKIGMIHNVVRHVDDAVVQYWTDTEEGSSGSPVFDERWRLVALHHRAVEHVEGGKREWRNQGRLITKVVEGMTAAGALT